MTIGSKKSTVGGEEFDIDEAAASIADSKDARVAGVWIDLKPLIRTAILRVVPVMMDTRFWLRRAIMNWNTAFRVYEQWRSLQVNAVVAKVGLARNKYLGKSGREGEVSKVGDKRRIGS